jgi:hypothetical protein
MRSADSFSARLLRSRDNSGEIAPPRTTIPSGVPSPFHGGKRFSRGAISQLPSGDQPAIASASRLAMIKPRPKRRRRVNNNAIPKSPTAATKFEGSAKKPSTFEITRNMTRSQLPRCLVKRS